MQIKELLEQMQYTVIDTAGKQLPEHLCKLERNRRGETIRFRLCYEGEEPAQLDEVILFDGVLPVSTQAWFYGEGYNKLSQYEMVDGKFQLIGEYGDASHYKLLQKENFHTVYNLIYMEENGEGILLAFSSCNRFSGEFRFNEKQLQIALKTEGITIEPGQSLELETFFAACGTNKARLFEQLAQEIQKNHPMLVFEEIPFGWSSWLRYGPEVNEADIMDNMKAIKKKLPELKYIQIDDGYQKHMGDWLECCEKFSDMQSLCGRIREEGFEPAVWAAPFIAEKDSAVFREHPEWFVRDETGEPLPSDRVSFGGWRCGPWYMLDGTHPDAREYLTHVFSVMRKKWGCRYFKLDANMWGALPFGRRYDSKATSIEAYRLGMKAILSGAGSDSFLLGCNAPMWPSLGTVHGMRITNDLHPSWEGIRRLARAGFLRNWQHNRLWLNDPDSIVLRDLSRAVLGPDGKLVHASGGITEEEFEFHAAYILAMGGLVLSGDEVEKLTEKQIGMIEKILKETGSAAVFADKECRIGRTKKEGEELLFFFNPTEEEISLSVDLEKKYKVCDFWTEADEGIREGRYTIQIAPHHARVFLLKAVL